MRLQRAFAAAILATLLAGITMSPASADANLAALLAQREALQVQLNQLSGAERAALQDVLATRDRLADLQRQLTRARADLAAVQNRTADLTTSIGLTRREVAADQAQLASLARMRYKTRDQLSFTEVVFGSKNFGEMVNRALATTSMSDRTHRVVAALRSLDLNLKSQVSDLALRQTQITTEEAQLAARQAAVQATAADYAARLAALSAAAAPLVEEARQLDAAIAAASPYYRGLTYSQQQIVAIIRTAGDRWHTNSDTLVRVARCESGLNPRDYNRSSGATGLFQFMPSTFYANGGKDIWDATDQSNIAAKMFSQGRASAWACK